MLNPLLKPGIKGEYKRAVVMLLLISLLYLAGGEGPKDIVLGPDNDEQVIDAIDVAVEAGGVFQVVAVDELGRGDLSFGLLLDQVVELVLLLVLLVQALAGEKTVED